MQAPARSDEATTPASEPLWVYLFLGIWLGTLFIKSEVASWFRIQEMFRFDAFHMYGVIGSAVAVAALSVALMKRRRSRTVRGEAIEWPDAELGRLRPNHLLGGVAFGLGWGLLGACPGPIFALIGTGALVVAVGLVGALAGAWTYGLLKSRLPH